jgi:hypothetical protein
VSFTAGCCFGVKAIAYDCGLLANRDGVNVIRNRKDASCPRMGSWNLSLSARAAAP